MAVRQIVKNARKNDGIPKTAQQSIPFDRMFPDGICRVGLDYYTKTVQFQDINYQLAQQEDKTDSMMSGMSIRKCSFTRWKREIMVLRRLNILLSGFMRSP